LDGIRFVLPSAVATVRAFVMNDEEKPVTFHGYFEKILLFLSFVQREL
jgi:hypothetical protein